MATVHWMFVIIGEALLLAYLIELPFDRRPGTPVWLGWLTAVSIMATAFVWYRGLRRLRYGGWDSVVDVAPLFLVALTLDVTSAATDLLLARTLLRSMRGSLPRKLLHTLGGLACVAAGLLLSTEPPDRAVARILVSGVVLILITLLFHVFLGNLARYDRALSRERVLAKVSGQLTGRVDQARIAEVVIGAVETLAGEGVRAAVAVGSNDRMQVVSTTEDLRPAVGALLRWDDGALRVAQPTQPQARLIGPMVDAPPPGRRLFPITAREELYGLLLADLPERIDPDVRATMESLCSSAGLALANAVLTEELTKLAFHDPLTRLANRSLLSEQTDTALARTARADSTVALLVLDLDGFKRINDEYGHLAGDEALVIVAARLLDQVREGDVVARLGGDEFAVLLTDLRDPGEATAVARRIIRALDGPLLVGDDEVPVGVSIGITVWPYPSGPPGSRTSRKAPPPGLDDLLHDADTVMYVAKSRGSGYELYPGRQLGSQQTPAEPGPQP